MEYNIIKGDNYREVVMEVNTLLRDKWELYGQLIALPNPEVDNNVRNDIIYVQALVKNYKD
jgi:hypothetical protein